MNKRQIRKEVAEMEEAISKTRRAKMCEILSLLPAGITLKTLKFAFIDKVVTANDGNMSAAARELAVPYRTMVNWVHETDYTESESRGRIAGGKANAKYRKKVLPTFGTPI
jgi:hypothetical protein